MEGNFYSIKFLWPQSALIRTFVIPYHPSKIAWRTPRNEELPPYNIHKIFTRIYDYKLPYSDKLATQSVRSDHKNLNFRSNEL